MNISGRKTAVLPSRRSPGGAKRGEESPAIQSQGVAGDPSPRYAPSALRQLGMTAALCISLLVLPLQAQKNSADAPKLGGEVTIKQKLDAQLPLDLTFRDEAGRVVRLSEYFRSGKPVLLNFVYYRCPMLCSMVLEGTTTSLTELKLGMGRDFEMITVSIDPRDTPSTAAEKKEKYVKRYGRSGGYDGWHFLTGPDMAIKKLTEAVGFHYTYDPKSDQFAHGTTLIALTPTGRISRYFYGFEYRPRDLRLGLVEASEGKIGTATDQIMLLCYHYDPITGKYTKSAMNFVRAGGVATVAALAGFIIVMIRTERRRAGIPPNQDDTK